MPRARKGTPEEQAIRDRCTQLRALFRRAWSRDPKRFACLAASRRKYNGPNKRQKYEHQCAYCKKWYKGTEVQVDHITPAGSFLELTVDCIGKFVYNLFQGELQVLCIACHTNIKTKAETQDRVKKESLRTAYPQEWSSWYNMVYRCTNEKATGYHRYGGRGIAVCGRWLDFANFLEDMGERPAGYSIERLDYDGNYDKENCIWADSKTQANNVSNNYIIDYNGVCKTVTQWAEELSIKPNTLLYRIRRGWSILEAFELVKRPTKQDVGSFSPWDINTILDMRRSGKTLKEIGEYFDIDGSCISRICTKFFCEEEFPKSCEKKHKKVLEMYNEGFKTSIIAEQLDISVSTVYYIIKKFT